MKALRLICILTIVCMLSTIYTSAQITTTIDVEADAKLAWSAANSATADNPYGSATFNRAETWTSSGKLYKLRFLIKFDVLSIPSDALITSATLYLYNPQDPGITWDYHSLNNSECTLKRVTSYWEESTVTWNSFDPSTSTVNQDAVPVPAATSSYQDYQLDVKDLVQGWINGTYANYGLFLGLDTESVYRRLFFASSDYSNSEKHPKIEITWKAVPSVNANYISTITAMSETGVSGPIQQNIQYFDGLGRLNQEVNVGGSPMGSDIVRPVVYDDFERIEKAYLPYKALNDEFGKFRDDALEEQKSFYQSHFELGATTEPYAYSRMVYESSPLNRIEKRGSPGESWQPIEETNGAQEYVQEFKYGSNILEEVRCFSINMSTGALMNNPAYYSENELYKNTFYDEDENLTEEFKDKESRVVLRRSWEGTTKHSTYYVYDDFGLLRYVLPPNTLGDNGVPSYLNELCYYYEYDGSKRMIKKKLPEVDSVFMVYDKRDRLVFSQDGEMRTTGNGKWLYTKYDALNRPVMTGIYEPSTSQSIGQMQSNVNQFYLNLSNPLYEVKTSTGHGYTELSYPTATANCELLTVTYYDEYNFRDDLTAFTAMDFNSTDNTDNYTDNDGINNGYFDRVGNQVTGTATVILDGTYSDWVYSVYYYDDRYRLIQQQQKMYPEGTAMISTRYDFVGMVEEVYEKQSVGVTNNNSLRTKYSYDHAGRLLETRVSVNNNPEVVLSQMKYNELGELAEKNLHIENSQSPVQSIDYSYNIRGWLTGINNPNSLNSDGDKFGMSLFYEKVDTDIDNTALYNGNISAIKWGRIPEQTIAYTFVYDDLNRLTNADYQITAPMGPWYNPDKYDTEYSYDLNGNITYLNRRDATGSLVDELECLYRNSEHGNQLYSVIDHSDNSDLYNDRDISPFFNYDANGNLIIEQDKGLRIDYNYLNLPKKIYNPNTGDDPEELYYIYDAAGVKWVKKLYSGFIWTKTMYTRSFIYKDNSGDYSNHYTFDYILNAEGKIYTDVSPDIPVDYHYFIKDHLGNTRVVFNGDGNVLQESDYYPFGMSFSDNLGGDNKYLYNGKELQDEQLGGVNLDWYDYGARFYDPALGRWHVIDNKAEKYSSFTPYAYAANNPILFVDPDGNDIVIWYKENNQDKSYRFTGTTENMPNNKFVTSVVKAWSYNVMNGGGDPSWEAATNSNISIGLVESTEGSMHDNGNVFWNPSLGSHTETDAVLSPATILDHELDHAVERLTNTSEFNDNVQTPDNDYGNKEEKRVITGSEQKTAKANGEIKDGQVTRTNHGGTQVVTTGATSTKIDAAKTREFHKAKRRKVHEYDAEPDF